MFVSKVIVESSTGDIINFNIEEFFDTERYGIVTLSDGKQKLRLPVKAMDINQGQNTIELEIEFKDLTIYADHTTFERLRTVLVDLEQNDGENGATNNDLGMHKV